MVILLILGQRTEVDEGPKQHGQLRTVSVMGIGICPQARKNRATQSELREHEAVLATMIQDPRRVKQFVD